MVPHDLTAMQWQPLYMIAIGRANTAADLARQMQVDTGAVTRMLDRLQAKALVRRERSTADRRIVYLELTDTGANVPRRFPRCCAMCSMTIYVASMQRSWNYSMDYCAAWSTTATVPALPHEFERTCTCWK